VEEGETLQVLHAPSHPYTRALMASSMLTPMREPYERAHD
ncbi:ABC transporter ATP-binding protein, partial [Burkholderia ubonensis]